MNTNNNFLVSVAPLFCPFIVDENLANGRLLVGDTVFTHTDGLGVFFTTKRVYGRIKSYKVKSGSGVNGSLSFVQEIILDNGMRLDSSNLDKANFWIET